MKKLSVALAVAVAAAAIGVSAAGAVTRYPSSVTLHFKSPSSTSDIFYGRDKSPHAACVPHRKNVIKRVTPGPDQTEATATGNADGKYHVQDYPTPAGKYYTKERRKVLANGNVCKRAKSATITVP